jgi:ribosome-binding factor A
MPREFSRTERLGDQIQRELATLLELEVKDPKLGMVTVTAVKVSRDLAHAKVYVTALGDAAQVADSMGALHRAAGFLRSALAKRLLVRTTPSLNFVYDTSVERGARLSALIDSALAADRELHPDTDESSEDDGHGSAPPGSDGGPAKE